VLVGALHWTDPVSVDDPQGLALAYLAHFEARGGRFLQGNAASLAQTSSGWSVRTGDGNLEARDAVIALGPWADTLTQALGYELPLAVKRGYHMHYRAAGHAKLNHPVLDHERGYFLAPMRRGIRLTTGAEFARRDAIKTPVQLGPRGAHRPRPVPARGTPRHRGLARRPPLHPRHAADHRPAPRHPNLWFAFGHAHHGLTLGPVTGRLVADLVTGETPFVDPAPYRRGQVRMTGSDLR
jgi:D-amino-acid dehydrogenase